MLYRHFAIIFIINQVLVVRVRKYNSKEMKNIFIILALIRFHLLVECTEHGGLNLNTFLSKFNSCAIELIIPDVDLKESFKMKIEFDISSIKTVPIIVTAGMRPPTYQSDFDNGTEEYWNKYHKFVYANFLLPYARRAYLVLMPRRRIKNFFEKVTSYLFTAYDLIGGQSPVEFNF